MARHLFVYNFSTQHRTLRVPLSLKSKFTDHVWSFEELVALIDNGGEPVNMRYQIQTDRRLWLAFGAVTFTLLGFVRLWPEGVDNKVGPGYFWGFLVSPPPALEWWRYLGTVLFGTAVLAVPAAALGWTAQAITMAIRSAKTAKVPN